MTEIKQSMEETMEQPVETPDTQCGPEAELTEEGVTREYDDATFAVLLAVVPLLIFALFGQIGLF